MIYLGIKSLHILAAIFWIGSFFLVSFVSSKSKMSPEQLSIAMRVTEGSIGFAWLFGGILTVMLGWYGSTWWYVKIALVFFVSAIHTFVHRRWKRAGEERVNTHPSVPFLIFFSSFLILIVVVFKIPS